ncbi:MAG TPA: hypothetical protein VFH51_17055, partial [Myxococcota bacterium]|nr:hypothetical protein [Myxococcota bacterium]
MDEMTLQFLFADPQASPPFGGLPFEAQTPAAAPRNAAAPSSAQATRRSPCITGWEEFFLHPGPAPHWQLRGKGMVRAFVDRAGQRLETP